MKKTVLLIVLLIAYTIIVFGKSQDTTFTANLSDGNNPSKISLKVKESKFTKTENGKKISESAYFFTLNIDGKSVTDTIPYNEYADVNIVDINKNDKSKEIIVTSGGDNDYYEYWVYSFRNEPRILLQLSGVNELVPDGNGKLTAYFWTGFCKLEDNYILSKDGSKLEKVKVDYYPVKKWTEEGETEYDAKVLKSFKLLSERNKNSVVVITTKPGEKVIITGYDSKYITIPENSEDYLDKYVWIQMKTQSGKTGWIMMSAYNNEEWNNLLDGVTFAG